MWEPTTRGTNPAEKVCHNGLCIKKTSEIMHYILDRHGIRYFCKEHWTDICVFMRDVRLCVDCSRNHRADRYEDAIALWSIKYADKWWDLCAHHFVTHDDSMCDFVPDITED